MPVRQRYPLLTKYLTLFAVPRNFLPKREFNSDVHILKKIVENQDPAYLTKQRNKTAKSKTI